MPPPALVPQAAAAPVYEPLPAPPFEPLPPPPRTEPGPTVLPPPGGWQPFDAGGAAVPPPPPLSSLPPPPGAPPPPGWYPGLPQARPKRRGWLIALCIVLPLVLLGAIGFMYERGTDPAAASDRDAANAALLTNSDLGGTFKEVQHRTVARSRGGLRVEDEVAECGAADSEFEKHGEAVVDSILQSQNGISVQVIAEEVDVVDSADAATPVLDAVVGTARTCVDAALRKGAGSVALDVQLLPSPAPTLGDRAGAFHGSVGAGRAALAINILVVQQGRAIVLLMAFDTTGSLQGPRLESMMHTLLTRLEPRFGA